MKSCPGYRNLLSADLEIQDYFPAKDLPTPAYRAQSSDAEKFLSA